MACWDESCLELANGVFHEDLCAYRAQARYGSRCLFDSSHPAIVDIIDGTRVEAGPAGVWVVAQQGPLVVVGRQVFDLARLQRVGVVSGTPLAIDRAGRVLVSSSPSGVSFPLGPLHWQVPRLEHAAAEGIR